MTKAITQERIKELLHYDPETGVFKWRVHRAKNAQVGDVAGHLHVNGYRRIYIDRVQYKAHRLAFLYMTGKFPEKGCDHINGDRADNRWENLREATHSQNMMNKRRYKNNKGEYKGVSFKSENGKYVAQIQKNGKGKHLGYFDSPEEAHKVYCEAAKELFGEFAYAGGT